jgi:hypothetical protein
MRCCGSPTTSTAADAGLRASDVASAVLFREILKPLAQGLGPVGEIALGAVADTLFVKKPR